MIIKEIELISTQNLKVFDEKFDFIIFSDTKNIQFVKELLTDFGLRSEQFQDTNTIIVKFSNHINVFELFYNVLLRNSKNLVFIFEDYQNIIQYFAAKEILSLYSNVQLLSNSLQSLQTLKNHLPSKMKYLINIGCSGTQSHLNPKIDQENHFDCYRLGQIYYDINIMDKPISYCTDLILDISVYCQAQIPSRRPMNTSGLDSMSINNMCRIAGKSKLNKSLIVSNFKDQLWDDYYTDTLSQAIYYYMIGHEQMNQTLNSVYKSYITDLPSSDLHAEFVKEEITNQWFLKFPEKLNEGLMPFQLIPCEYSDYERILQGEMNPRLESIISRLAEMKVLESH